MVPSYYLEYYYHTDRMLELQTHWPPSRAESVMSIEADLLKDYANPDLIELPENLMKRGGAYYSTAATQLINSHFNNLGEIHTVNVRPQRCGGWLACGMGLRTALPGGSIRHPSAAGKTPAPGLFRIACACESV